MRKPVSETQALARLDDLKADLRSEISNFESRAKSCAACETPGACCLDEHFVNVHISRLEAVAIERTVEGLPPEMRKRVVRRIDEAVGKYGLTADGDTFEQRYACPLFEKGLGCLVHRTAKPVPCIVHACYENKSDLPPPELQTTAERQIDELNARVYGRPLPWLPLPLAITRLRRGAA